MRKILTLVVDGIGISDDPKGNAFAIAKTPTFDKLFEAYPHSRLVASGKEVGQSENDSGNSLVGFETLTAGQRLRQQSAFARKFMNIDNLSTNRLLRDAIKQAKEFKSTIHVMGLMSDGGVDSNIKDTIDLLNFLKNEDIRVVVDVITDGKNSESKSAMTYINEIEETGVPIASVCGRYYAMDTNQKYDRTKVYYDLVRYGVGLKVEDISLALKNCYIRNITDEYIPPIKLMENKEIKDNDVIIWMNYEKDTSKQILVALTNPDLIDEFKTEKLYNIKTMLLFPIDANVNGTVLINEEEDLSDNLGAYFGKLGMTQARIASAESFDYVTYYFNGKIEKKIPKCNNYSISVPKDTPEIEKVKSVAITKQIIKCMEKDTDFILADLDAADNFGHTGDFDRTIDIIEFLDECLSRIIESAEMNFYKVVLLSTHGNVENMQGEEEKKLTTNTNNKVPFLITDRMITLMDGSLKDVAPTILSYMDISIPERMKESRILYEKREK